MDNPKKLNDSSESNFQKQVVVTVDPSSQLIKAKETPTSQTNEPSNTPGRSSAALCDCPPQSVQPQDSQVELITSDQCENSKITNALQVTDGSEDASVHSTATWKGATAYQSEDIVDCRVSMVAKESKQVSTSALETQQESTKLDANRTAKQSDHCATAADPKTLAFSAGLENTQNNCYLNAVVQAINHLSGLQNFYIIDKEVVQEGYSNKATLTSSLSEILFDLRSKKSRVISPADFKNVCGSLCSDYSEDKQRDAQEFCGFLINGLIDEEETLKKSNSRARTSFQKLFEGLILMSLVCDACSDSSEAFQPFIVLSLPVQSESFPIQLEVCLNDYFQPETLLNRTCPNCSTTAAQYRTAFIHLPQVLVIQLMRFNNSSKKVETRVRFPIRDLDLSSWASCTDEENHATFDLKAVVNHFGNDTSEGHYTSYCKHPINEGWFSFNDKWVDKITDESIQTKAAYMLFYEQRPHDESKVEEARCVQPFDILSNESKSAKKTAETQQLNPPSIFNMDDIREARRDKALRILDEVLPALVVRLRALHRRSKAAADERGCFSGDQLQGATDGNPPFTGAKIRSLPNRLNKLLESASELLKEHTELMKEENESAFAKKKKSNGKRWKKLMDEATKLAEEHAKIRHSDQPDEEYGLRKAIEDARLILRHPVFDLLQPEEEPMQLQEEEENSADSCCSEPLFDTAEMIRLVTGEMRKIIECSRDLKHWITLSTPPLDVITDYESLVRDRVTSLIDDLVFVCEDSLKYLEEFLLKRMEFLKQAIEKPLSIDRMRVVDAFDSTKAIEWRRHTSRLVLQSLEVMDFIVKHREVLDECKSRLHNNDTTHICR